MVMGEGAPSEDDVDKARLYNARLFPCGGRHDLHALVVRNHVLGVCRYGHHGQPVYCNQVISLARCCHMNQILPDIPFRSTHQKHH